MLNPMSTHRIAPDCALHDCGDDCTGPRCEPDRVAASGPDRRAQATREFIARVSPSRGQALAGA